MSDIASRMAALKSAHTPKPKSTGSNSYYPFYNMGYDENCVIRFLPDLNTNNPLVFMYEKMTHNLPTADGKSMSVPCLKMYGESECPICKRAAEHYKAEGKESKIGKMLYVKRSYLTQALVVKDPLPYKEGETPATGQVRIVGISPSIYGKIQSAFADDDLRNPPEDYKSGTDFMIKKTKKGEYANYENSKFLRDERALSDAEMVAIEGKLVDLSTLRPAKPEVTELIMKMEAAIAGTLEPSNASGNASTGSSSGSSSASAAYNKPAANPNEYLNQSSASSESSSSIDDEAQDILNQILNRQ